MFKILVNVDIAFHPILPFFFLLVAVSIHFLEDLLNVSYFFVKRLHFFIEVLET